MAWSDNLLSLARDERVILATIGASTFALVGTVLTTLVLIRDDTEIPQPEPKTQYITQDTEDALSADTISRLLDHPNYHIRDATTRIICDRATNDPAAITELLYGITRPDYDERMRCLRALAMLTGHTPGLDGLSKLNNSRAYSALMRSLQLSLDDAPLPELRSQTWDEYYLRDMAERFCLMFVYELMNNYGAEPVIKAGFVAKWLAKQDWGDSPDERQTHFKHYMEHKKNRIVDIVGQIQDSRRGLRALEKAGLMDRVLSKWQNHLLPTLTANMMEHGSHRPQRLAAQVARTREHSEEEQRLRRQHREAMVLNDGSRPVGRDDIFERDHSPPT
ncbi:hypothetical protein B0I35DRAFT_473947 [Stachybotrys elegans]|uniref:Cytoskeleton-associated protein n=1 Tax=Stachybotrys elegans TaxID=80388 RepID=A0A8K0T8L4_9HYPO|nr:hypothetical protein B0I35DRAFT_473947 [Stachybotrys elegans]